jgi:2,3-bisphosphoglycerate-independent phosphoglycerate mutase
MGDAQRKIDMIERFDEQVVGTVLAALRQTGGEWRVLVTPGHATPCALRTHTAEPVPFTVYVSSDEVKPRALARGYSEREARDQGVFISEAHTLMERLLRH